MGLETIHPDGDGAAQQAARPLALRCRGARFSRDNDIDLRVFVLLGAPYVPAEESVEWTVRTVEYAVARGASVVSIIPVRGGNGEMERLAGARALHAADAVQLEDALDGCLQVGASVVTADLWDVERLPRVRGMSCSRGSSGSRRLNVSGRAEPRVDVSSARAAR